MIPADLSPLANHLWQSTIFAAVAALLAFAFRRNSASIRYWLWFAASIKFLIPFSILVSAGSHIHWSEPSAIDATPLRRMIEISRPFARSEAVVVPVGKTSTGASSILFLVWCCGFAVGVCGWLRAWLRIRAMLRASSPLRLATEIPKVMCVPARMEPGVVGIFRPVLLLPEGISGRLTPEELKTIIAHELCHIRRRDNLTAAIHLCVETLFWFYPVVRWVGKRMLAERERACDEEVVRGAGEPDVYARAILNICRLYHESPIACAAGVTGSNLKKRIEAIVRNERALSLSAIRKAALVGTTAFAIAAPVAVGAISALAGMAQTLPMSVDGPSFEVASVKPTPPAQRLRSADSTLQNGRYVATNQTLMWLIEVAYATRATFPAPINLARELISGGPDWITKERFTVEASAGRAVTGPEMARMLRRLLADRFKLKVHVETREMPVYALARVSETRLGPQLRASEDCVKSARRGIGGGPGVLALFCSPMPLLAESLSEIVDRTVIDRTNLTQTYEGKLEFAPTEAEIGVIFGGQRPPEDATTPQGASIFTALREQFGLRLTSERAAVDFLVIDSAERPAEN
jgi:bla regulator protein blaR1